MTYISPCSRVENLPSKVVGSGGDGRIPTSDVGRLVGRLVPQRYGLSVFLRKAYPELEPGTKYPEPGTNPAVHGADVETAPWDDLPADLRNLVRRRAQTDAIVRSHLAPPRAVSVLRIADRQSVTLANLLAPGRLSTIFIDVAPRAEVTISEGLESAFLKESRFQGGDIEEGVASALVLLQVGAGSRVRWFATAGDDLGFRFVERVAVLEQDAVLEHSSVLMAANAIRENIQVVLAAPGATVLANTLFAGSADHQFDLGVTAEHRAPHTTSNLRARGVLGGKAQGVYRGLVRVERAARAADGYQRCDALLLSPTAEVDPIPSLEIETNDVRCTHGVTVSHVNPEQLFYLQSRGLTDGAARDLLVEGFTGTILRSYPAQRREELRTAMQNVLRTP